LSQRFWVGDREREVFSFRKKAKAIAMGWIGETVDSIKSLQIRQVLTQAVSLGQFGSSSSSSSSSIFNFSNLTFFLGFFFSNFYLTVTKA